ncbi:MAG: tripartite tricarboxylate transporter TctB family protein [Geminicoccales bacterium]
MTSTYRLYGLTGPILALIGALALFASLGIDPDPDGGQGARIFPIISAVVLMLLGTLETLTASRTSGAEPFGLVRVLLLLLLALVYVFGINLIGYLAATAIVAPFALMLFGRDHPLELLAAALLCPIVYHLLFFVGLGVFPPDGIWFDLQDLWR